MSPPIDAWSSMRRGRFFRAPVSPLPASSRKRERARRSNLMTREQLPALKNIARTAAEPIPSDDEAPAQRLACCHPCARLENVEALSGATGISPTRFESSQHRADTLYRLLEIAKQSHFLDDASAALFGLFAIETRHDDPAVILTAVIPVPPRPPPPGLSAK
jgi:hypothetical protein